MSGETEKEPALSPRATRGIAVSFALLIVAAVFLALAMLLGWGLVALWELLFG